MNFPQHPDRAQSPVMDTIAARQYLHDLTRARIFSKFETVNETSLNWWHRAPELAKDAISSYKQGLLPAVEAAALVQSLIDVTLWPQTPDEGLRAGEELTRIITANADAMIYQKTCYPAILRGDDAALKIVNAGAEAGNPWPAACKILEGTHTHIGWLEDYDLGGYHEETGLPSSYALDAYTWKAEQLPRQARIAVCEFAKGSRLRGDTLLQTASETLNLNIFLTGDTTTDWKEQANPQNFDLLAYWDEQIGDLLNLSEPKKGAAPGDIWDVLGELSLVVPTVDEFLLGEVEGWPANEPKPEFTKWSQMVTSWCTRLCQQIDNLSEKQQKDTKDSLFNVGFAALSQHTLDGHKTSPERQARVQERARMLLAPSGEDQAMRTLTAGAARSMATAPRQRKPDTWTAACLLAGAGSGTVENWDKLLSNVDDKSLKEFYNNTWSHEGRSNKGVRSAAKTQNLTLKPGRFRRTSGQDWAR